MVTYTPERGDVVWLTFGPSKGHEQTGRRPALVLSPRLYNQKTGLALFCPITSKMKGYQFEVVLTGSMAGVVLADHVRLYDWRERKIGFIERAPTEVVEETRAKLSALING